MRYTTILFIAVLLLFSCTENEKYKTQPHAQKQSKEDSLLKILKTAVTQKVLLTRSSDSLSFLYAKKLALVKTDEDMKELLEIQKKGLEIEIQLDNLIDSAQQAAAELKKELMIQNQQDSVGYEPIMGIKI